MKKMWMFSGIIAAALYIVTVIVGGALMPGYSHVRNAISSLQETGAPVIPAVWVGFFLYGLFLLHFSAGLWAEMRRLGHRTAAAGAALLAAVGLASILMTWFRQDAIGAPLTFWGIGHFVLAGVEALGTMLGILLCGLGFRRIPHLSYLRPYSIISAAVVLVSGGVSAGTMAIDPYFGINERITIGTFILWLCVVSLRLVRMPERVRVGAGA